MSEMLAGRVKAVFTRRGRLHDRLAAKGIRMFKKILVPIDGSECANHALDEAAAFAREQNAQLMICAVMEPQNAEYAMAYATPDLTGALFEALQEACEGDLKEAAKRVAPLTVKTVLCQGSAADEIVKTARELGADLIVMGSHGRRGLSHFFLGSVAEGVLQRSAIPVMVVRFAGSSEGRDAQEAVSTAATA
jgi:nucleotide-binding universal stress UspA family protein